VLYVVVASVIVDVNGKALYVAGSFDTNYLKFQLCLQ